MTCKSIISTFHSFLNAAAKISVRPRKGMAEGGCGGNSAIPFRKIEASPAALLVQSRTQQKSFLFLLEEKIRRAQIKKCGENFFAGWRALASGGGASVSLKKGSRIFKQRAPNWTSRFFGSQSDSLLAAPNGAARKELLGKIKRRDEIPRHNFFGNEAVRHCEAMYKNEFLFQFFAQNIPLRGIEAIFHSLAEHKPRQNIKL